MRKLTVELVISGVIVSLLETLLLKVMGFLNAASNLQFIFISVILTVIELVLMFVIEEIFLRAKRKIKIHFGG